MASQVLQKSYECLTCKKQIRIAKIDNAGPNAKKRWQKYELDGLTAHICFKEEAEESATKETPKQQPSPESQKLSGDYLLATLAENLSLQSNKIDGLQKEIQMLTAAIKELQAKNGGIPRKQ